MLAFRRPDQRVHRQRSHRLHVQPVDQRVWRTREGGLRGVHHRRRQVRHQPVNGPRARRDVEVVEAEAVGPRAVQAKRYGGCARHGVVVQVQPLTKRAVGRPLEGDAQRTDERTEPFLLVDSMVVVAGAGRDPSVELRERFCTPLDRAVGEVRAQRLLPSEGARVKRPLHRQHHVQHVVRVHHNVGVGGQGDDRVHILQRRLGVNGRHAVQIRTVAIRSTGS